MTIQVASLLSDVVMILAGATVVGLAGVAVVQALRGRARPALRLGAATLGIVAFYGALLVGVALASGPEQLRPGDAKCFDDWCVAMVAAQRNSLSSAFRSSAALDVDVRVENRGRGRTMSADLARAYLEVPGRGDLAPQDSRGLHVRLAPGQHADVRLVFPSDPGVGAERFVVVEGAGGFGPGVFEIGGEGSPFHAVAGWPLSSGGGG